MRPVTEKQNFAMVPENLRMRLRRSGDAEAAC